MNKVHTFQLELNWKLINEISKIDRFDASWDSVERRQGSTLKQLKSIATVRSVGASTRIEGSKMSDIEVDKLLQNLKIDKLEDRDSQEVAGYFEILDLISEENDSIRISENDIKNLHNGLMRYSEKENWHKGKYKQLSNSVEATMPDGTKQIIFETTPPGYETDEAMRKMIEWYEKDNTTHPLVKCALLSYEFVSIHPFQDGNGRISRLLNTLSLLKNGYRWIQYVSFEHEIESRKTEYYRELRRCQAQRPNEDVTSWVYFYFDALLKIQRQLMTKLDQSGIEQRLTIKQKSILLLIENYAGISSGEISERLKIPNPTTKRILRELIEKELVERIGKGRGTSYRIL